MKKFELNVGICAIIGISLKLLRMPGGNIVLLVTLGTLALFYYGLSFAFFNKIELKNIFKKESYKTTNTNKIIGAIGLGWALSIVIIGFFHKLLFLAGANLILLIGLIALGIILFISIIFYFRNKAAYYKRIFKRIAIYGGIGLMAYITPSSTLVDIYYRNDPAYAEIYKKVLASPDDVELQKQLELMRMGLWNPEQDENQIDELDNGD